MLKVKLEKGETVEIELPGGKKIVLDCVDENSLLTPLRKGWQSVLTARDSGTDTRLRNISPKTGKEIFFAVDTSDTPEYPNPYGAPIVIQETTYAIPTSAIGVSEVMDRVVGAVVLDSSGKVTDRFGFTNVIEMKGQSLEITSGGELIVAGVSKGFIALLHSPDKNRMKGMVGYFTPRRPAVVQVVELENIPMTKVLPPDAF